MNVYDMICTCDPDGQRAAETMRLDVQRQLGCEAAALSLAVVASLNEHFRVQVRVRSDQWFRVAVILDDFAGSVDCDLPLDGMCKLWQELAGRFPDRVPSGAGVNDAIAQESEAQLAESEASERAWEAHQAMCEACAQWERTGAVKSCAAGRAIFDRGVAASRRLDEKWGLPAPQDAPWWWGMPHKEESHVHVG